MSGFDPEDIFDLNGDGKIDGADAAFLFNELFGEDDDLEDDEDEEYD